MQCKKNLVTIVTEKVKDLQKKTSAIHFEFVRTNKARDFERQRSRALRSCFQDAAKMGSPREAARKKSITMNEPGYKNVAGRQDTLLIRIINQPRTIPKQQKPFGLTK